VPRPPGQRPSRQWTPVPCSDPETPTRVTLSLRWQSRLMPGSCLAVHFALRLEETNVPPQAPPIAKRPRRSCAPQWVLRGNRDMAVGDVYWCRCRWPLLVHPTFRLYRGLCPMRSWTIAVPGLAEPLGFSRTTPLKCLNWSTARPLWMIAWFSGTRGFGFEVANLLFVGFPRRSFRRLDLLLLNCFSRAAGWLGSLALMTDLS